MIITVKFINFVYFRWKLECAFQIMVSITFTIFYCIMCLIPNNNLLLFVDDDYTPIEFVTLKDGSEGLIVYDRNEKKYKFLDPFLPSDAIDITNIIDSHKKIVITKSSKKLSIVDNNVHVTNGLNENTFQQMFKQDYLS